MTDHQEEWVLVPKKPTLAMSQAVREETRWCDPVGIYQKMLAAAPPRPAIIHCDNCGCDWLDNGLNPVGCPYCKQHATAPLQAENEALREDAARYRWLRGEQQRIASVIDKEYSPGYWEYRSGDELDSAIDEARKQGGA